jgi:FkbM family methyltransferase
METVVLPMTDGVQVVVPMRITQLTSYVLAEQQDWFEDEIRFVRRLLKPGDRVVDIGGGLGVYTLSMAKRVGGTGIVHTFEPLSDHVDLIQQSLQLNQLSNVKIHQRVVSDRPGLRKLVVTPLSEATTIYHPESATVQPSVTVECTTLDAWHDVHRWPNVDFIKIDAEGEENLIVQGASRFLKECSPLIQYEIQSGGKHEFSAMKALAAMGYDMYRLVPGLNILVPFEPNSNVDVFAMNLFACKSDRAVQLSAQQLLLRREDLSEAIFDRVLAYSKEPGAHDCRQWLFKFPYAERLLKEWKESTAAGKSTKVLEAMNLYGISRDFLRAPLERYTALVLAGRVMAALCESQKVEFVRLATLARISFELGNRAAGLSALTKLMMEYYKKMRFDLSEPFLSPCSRYDFLAPRDAIGSWLVASSTEAFEFSRLLSSFYGDENTIEKLESLCDLGYANDAITRRITLKKNLQIEIQNIQ